MEYILETTAYGDKLNKRFVAFVCVCMCVRVCVCHECALSIASFVAACIAALRSGA